MSTQHHDAGAPQSWGAVVPAKRLSSAKSRLATLGDDVRRDLVLAFLHDTVSAVLDTAGVTVVVVVTDDLALARIADDLGAWSIPDGHGTDLNASLVQGAADVARRVPGAGVLTTVADLPALRAHDLDAWLAVGADAGSALVADHSGTGTTILRAASSDGFAPAFGARSREAHVTGGAHDLSELAPLSLRQDVDTPADLESARALGLGERTRWVLTRHRL